MGMIIKNGVVYAGGGGGSSSHEYSTTERVVGKWVDGSNLYEKTYIFGINDLHERAASSSEIHGQFWLQESSALMWIEKGFIFSESVSILSNPVNYPTRGEYIRSNIQCKSDINGGKPFIYYEQTYSASSYYTYRDSIQFIFVIRYVKNT